MGIQLFTPTFHIEECLKEIEKCLEKGWTGIGFKTFEFEEAWKAYTGLCNAHFLNSATAGLHLAVKIFKMLEGWQEGDEIISTPLTFVSTNHAIAYEKLKVVFADVDEYLCLDPKSVESHITSRTKAIMFVGLGGSTGQYEGMVKLCKKYHLKLILDAAHMAGTKLNGEIPGKEADAVVYSFQAVKNLPTADSGMICFKEKEADTLCRKLSWLGIDKDTYMRDQGNYKWHYEVEYLGYKYHGNSIMAAIGLVQLKYLEEDNTYRRLLAKWYDEELAKCIGIQKISIPQQCLSSQHLYMLLVPERDALLQVLNKREIYPGVHYRDNTEYSLYAYAKGSCPKAKYYSDHLISLPLHLRLTKEDIKGICEEVKRHMEALKGVEDHV
ncbi:aminotransferase DegT [Sporanaerobium hydrogeniformans]|uniref:Aminotransferase DegT n=1 Tax=Sporanaerobium hydrogeniformans TaxID=3072179 RepID=A0AC61DDK3_9FIRM|nr:DegT/DnrJ/EryC1/StrS family aminotransferase [Sporanaerobium hydrogeniformans]PHV70888.1 aminotransferase DegT [Sporanaerobium hydrogeniformans]